MIFAERHFTCKLVLLDRSKGQEEGRGPGVQGGIYTKSVIKPVEMHKGISLKINTRSIYVRKTVAFFDQKSRVGKEIFKIIGVKISSRQVVNKKAGKNKSIVFYGL
jgi:hypothetical protein